MMMTIGSSIKVALVAAFVAAAALISPASAQQRYDKAGNAMVNCAVGCSGGGSGAITSWGGATLGAGAAYGTAPTGNAAGVNAFVTNPITTFGAYTVASITRSANTTTYTANTGWNNGTPTFFTFTAACRANGTQILIPQIDIWSSANPTLKLTGVLWLFFAVPGTNVSDDSAFSIASADFANLINKTGFPFALTNGQVTAGAANSGTSITGATYAGRCPGGTTSITGMVEVTNAYVPTSAEILSVGLSAVGVN